VQPNAGGLSAGFASRERQTIRAEKVGRMTDQRAARSTAWGQESNPPMEHLERSWALLAAEKVFREDGTTAREARVRRTIRS
jgi:hypothetical protein